MSRRTALLVSILFFVVAGWIALGFFAEPPERASSLVWLDDVPTALAQAEVENKHVLLDFTGSDWCPGCRMLHRRVWTSEEFESYAKTNLVLVTLDFPHAKVQPPELKKANAALSEKYNVQGFPTVILLDSTGRLLAQTSGYSGEPVKDFINDLNQIETGPVKSTDNLFERKIVQ